MAEALVNFLARMAFLLANDGRDADVAALRAHTLALLSEALGLWPTVKIRLSYMERLLQQAAAAVQAAAAQQPQGGRDQQAVQHAAQAAQSHRSALQIGLNVVNRVLAAQPRDFVLDSTNSGARHIMMLVEPAFGCAAPAVPELLAQVLAKLYAAFPPGTELPPEAAGIQGRVTEVMRGALARAADPKEPMAPGDLLRLAATVRVLEALAPVAPQHVDELWIMGLVSALFRLASDHSNAKNGGGPIIRQDPNVPRLAERAEGKEAWQPDYASLTWVVQHSLRLGAPHVLGDSHRKNYFLRAMVCMITGQPSRLTDPAVLMEMLAIVRSWLLSPPPSGGLSEKESALFMERLAALERSGATEGPIKGAWEDAFLDLTHRLITQPGTEANAHLKASAFRVERTFLIGLRAQKPETRQKFFALYNELVPKTIFDRLKYIFMDQDWERLSHTFWLKQAQDMLLALLAEDQPLHLAGLGEPATSLIGRMPRVPPPPIKQRVPAGLTAQAAPADGQTAASTQQQRQMMLVAQPSGNLPPGVAPQQVQRLPSATSVPAPAQPPTAPGGAQLQQPPAPAGGQQLALPQQQQQRPQTPAAGQPLQVAPQPAAPGAGQPQPMEVDTQPGQPQPAVAPAAAAATPVGQLAPAAGTQPPAGSAAQQPAAPSGTAPAGATSAPAVQRPASAAALPGQQSAAAAPPQPVQPSAPQPTQPPMQPQQQQATPPLPSQPQPVPGKPPQQLAMQQAAPQQLAGAATTVPARQPSAQPAVPMQRPPTANGAASQIAVASAAQPQPAQPRVLTAEEKAAAAAADARAAAATAQLPEEVQDVLQLHTGFLEEMGAFRVREWLGSLREAANGDDHIADHLWTLTFPVIWATLSGKQSPLSEKDQQNDLARPIITLLQKPYHERQAALRPNVIQTLLASIGLCQPQPKVPSELIRFLGKTYCAWHNATWMLEQHVMIFPQDPRCFDALAEMYGAIGEEDVLAGLWKRRCRTENTRAGEMLMQVGLLPAAQDVFLDACRKPLAPDTPITKGEQVLWHDQYIKSAAELCQWEAIAEYARQADNCQLQMDSLWRLGDWDALKRHVLPRAQVDDGSWAHMVHAYVHLQEGNIVEGEQNITNAMKAALIRWWQLPQDSIWPQLGLLQGFQQMVELQESSRILVDLGQQMGAGQRADHTYTELKEIMETWRLRTPNEWERAGHWADVLMWRNHIYNIVINAFKNVAEVAPQLHQLGYRDKAWSVNRLGAVARRHGYGEACLRIINSLYGFNAMEVQEAFIKIREQAKAYLAQPGEQLTGLNLLNTTNLDYFNPQHQAEVFRLKGLFHQALTEHEQANQAFSTALSLWPNLADGWLSWGAHCDAMYQQSGNPTWLQYAVTCYLQAIRNNSSAARSMLPRVLGLLSFDDVGGVVSRALAAASDMPLAVWLPHLPSLLSSLQRPEQRIVKPLLIQLGLNFPQALYYQLRTFLLATRENAMAAVKENKLRRDAAAKAAAARAAGGGGASPSVSGAKAEPAKSGASGGGDAAVSMDVDAAKPQQPAGAQAPPRDSPQPSAAAQPQAPQPAAQPQAQQPAQQQPPAVKVEAGTAPANPTAASSVQGASSAGTPVAAASPSVSQQQSEQPAGQGAAQQPPAQQPIVPATQQSAAGQQPPQPPRDPKPPEVVHFDTVKEVMDALRGQHPALTASLEAFLTDIGAKFVPTPEERLLSVVHALLHRCYKLPFSNAATVPDSLRRELANVCRACFSGEGVARHGALVAAYRAQFVAELNPEGAAFPGTLGELVNRLKAWRATLQATVEAATPGPLRLEQLSRKLQEQPFTDVEMPGQHSTGEDPSPDGVVLLVGIGADVPVVRRHGTSFRRLALLGSDGKQRHFIVQTGQHYSAAVGVAGANDERMAHLMRAMNRLLDRHPQSRRRHLAWHTPAIVPVWPQVRLVEEEPSYMTYGSAFEVYCARYGREVDTAIATFKNRCCARSGGPLPDSEAQRRFQLQLKAYKVIEAEIVNDQVFSQFIYKIIPDKVHMWTFKKQLNTQMALSGLLSHAMTIGGRSPNKILLARASGRVWQIDFFPAYDGTGALERPEPVPFRLTRNLANFFTPFGVEGIFVTSLIAGAQGVLGTHTNLPALLQLFFRDDLSAWAVKRSGGRGGGGPALPREQLKQLCAANADACLQRLRTVAPSAGAAGVEGGLGIQAGAHRLVEAAQAPDNLCRMDATWHPWY